MSHLSHSLRAHARLFIACTLTILVLALAALAPQPVAARNLPHEHVDVGPYDLAIGWSAEPAYVGQLNGLELEIVKKEDESPIEGVEKTLTFEVEYGGQKKELPLRGVFGEPGAYTADILPSQRGQYTFHFTGKIEAENADVTIQPDEVEAPDEVTFPSASAAPAQNAELDNMRMMTWGALALGLLGVVLGGVALMSARKK